MPRVSISRGAEEGLVGCSCCCCDRAARSSQRADFLSDLFDLGGFMLRGQTLASCCCREVELGCGPGETDGPGGKKAAEAPPGKHAAGCGRVGNGGDGPGGEGNRPGGPLKELQYRKARFMNCFPS